MSTSIVNTALIFVFGLSGFILAQIAQRIAVPILVRILGEKRFASPDAFDGCTLGIVGGFLAVFSLPLFERAGRHPLWVFPILFSGITLYGVVWLWLLGLSARKREWRVENGQVLNRENQVLQPTFVRRKQDYHQTDAFNGYSQYFLILHDNEKELATNAYNSERDYEADIEAVNQLLRPRQLDLNIVWPEKPLKWAVFLFSENWTSLLCGSLEKLNREQRMWWRMWLLPSFPVDKELEIDIAEWREHLTALSEAYPDYWTQYSTYDIEQKSDSSPEIKVRPQNWTDSLKDLEWIWDHTTSGVLAMGTKSYEDKVKAAVGGPAHMLHSSEHGPYVELSPLYGQPKSRNESPS